MQQPQQIQDSGIFNDKAITYVKYYIDRVMEQLVKQIDHLLEKVNVLDFIMRDHLIFCSFACATLMILLSH